MTVEYGSRPHFEDHQVFNPPEPSPQRLDALHPRPKDPQIEKCLEQLVKKGLWGRPSVKDYLYDLKRRHCRPNTHREEYFRAMARIEQGEAYDHHQRHFELPPVF